MLTIYLILMKTAKPLCSLILLLLLSINLFSQSGETSALICGRISIEKDSISPLRPYSIILQKSWPVTFREFEQVLIDTTDNSFRIEMDLDQLTYGNIIVNFFPDVDTTYKERHGMWISTHRSDSFYKREYTGRIFFSALKFVIEPGDSLHMLVDYDHLDHLGRASVHFTGRGAGNNNHLRSSDTFYQASRNFRLPLKAGLNNEDSDLRNELTQLAEAKDSLSPAYFDLLSTDARFDNLGNKHALIRASLYGPEVPVEDKRTKARTLYSFLDTLSLKSEYLVSREFRSFMPFYLEYVNRIVTGEDIAYSYDEKNYYLAKAVFEKEVLKTFLFERLSFQMDELKFFPAKTYQYEEFMKQFPNTPESHRLTRLYNKRFPVSVGQPAPDLELIDASGKTTRLSRLKGKVVLISNYTYGSFPSVLEEIEALQNKLAGNKLEVVALSTQYIRPGYKVSPYIDYYVKDEVQNQNQYSYRFLLQHHYTFVVNKHGFIEDCVLNLNIPNETIYDLRLERYTVLTRLNGFAQEHTVWIIAVLAFLLTLSLVFFFTSRLKQKRQELIEKQLNSELKAIRSQLNPHFLFNSLNSLQNFINQSDKQAANKHLSRFAQLMRKVIEMSEKESTSLQEEIDFNKTFIELEQLRYGFKCNFNVDEGIDLINTEIPSMIIQPFIENAVVHCMADLGTKGKLDVFVTEAGPREIMVEVRDNGKGFQAGSSQGFGLKSSRERIDIYNAQHRNKIKWVIEKNEHDPDQQGSVVRLIIPKKY
jgi:signal transduction histidine kinase